MKRAIAAARLSARPNAASSWLKGPTGRALLRRSEGVCRPTPMLLSSSRQRRMSTTPRRAQAHGEAQSYSAVHFPKQASPPQPPTDTAAADDHPPPTDHAVISLFDLYSIGLGPSSSHTIGPMRAALIFVRDIQDRDPSLLRRIAKLKIALYGALAATGEGHLTPQALLAGFEGEDPEEAEPAEVPRRYHEILETKQLLLGKKIPELDGGISVEFDYKKDLAWHWDKKLPLHPNGMRFSVFSSEGDLLATNDYFSVGGGFVVNGALALAPSADSTGDGAKIRKYAGGGAEEEPLDSLLPAATRGSVNFDDSHAPHPVDLMENVFYKEVRRADADESRRGGMPKDAGSGNASDAGLPSPDDEGGSTIAASDQGPTPVATNAESSSSGSESSPRIPIPFHNGETLLRNCARHNLTIAQLVFQNELTWRTGEEVRDRVFRIWDVMDAAIREGCHSTIERLPAPTSIKRRAPGLYRRLMRGLYPGTMGVPPGENGGRIATDRTTSPAGAMDEKFTSGPSASDETSMSRSPTRDEQLPAESPRKWSGRSLTPPTKIHGSLSHHPLPTPPRRAIATPAIDFLSVYAIAVNEVNAAGGKVVTAPTLGSCGTIPAVLNWHLAFHSDDQDRDIETFLLTGAAMAMLFKRGASLSASEGGCMSEVGVATAMAAAGLTAVLGGTPEQVAHAAEIGMEHSLGLTCDPVSGQVAVPCIERNAIGAITSVAAAQLALATDEHAVSLDAVITAMKETAEGMHERFKETSLAGLAKAVKIPVVVPAC